MGMTLGQIRTLTRTLLSESTASYWSDAELNNYINYGLDDFCNLTDVLEDISTDSLVQYKADYTLPSDYTKLKQVEIVRGNSINLLWPEDLQETYTGIVKTTSNPPTSYNLWEGNLRIRERPASSAQATTLNGTITSSATTLVLTDASGFPRAGRLLIGSEVIVYWMVSTNTLSGLERGAEGTTAAAHTDLDAVTLRDIWMYHYKKDATLTIDLDTPNIPSQFHEGLAYYAASLGRRKSKDHDLANEYTARYQEFVGKGLDWSKYKWRRSYRPK
jgi:hypothetical protein